MDRTERFYKMEQLLRAQKVVPRRQFMDEIGVSLATFKRDLEYMRERLHAPIAFNSERGGYELLEVGGDGPRFARFELARRLGALAGTLQTMNRPEPVWLRAAIGAFGLR